MGTTKKWNGEKSVCDWTDFVPQAWLELLWIRLGNENEGIRCIAGAFAASNEVHRESADASS